MKRTLIVLLTLAVMMVGSQAFAASTATLNITATVVGVCLFDAPSTTMALGTLDPTLGDYTSAVHTVTFTCSPGAAPTSVVVPATGALTSVSTSGSLPYALSETNTFTPGVAGAQGTGTINITADVLAADMLTAPAAADYLDAQPLTINY